MLYYSTTLTFKRLGKFSKVTPSACLSLGTDIVWKPTPNSFSRCSLCIINDKTSNLGTYILFQETYHKPTYDVMHPNSLKSSYEYHLNAFYNFQL